MANLVSQRLPLSRQVPASSEKMFHRFGLVQSTGAFVSDNTLGLIVIQISMLLKSLRASK